MAGALDSTKLQWQLHPILSDDFTSSIADKSAYACSILNKRDTRTLILALNKKYPGQGIGHLKRVHTIKDTPVILLTDNELVVSDIMTYLCGLDLVKDVLDQPFKVSVPVGQAKTKMQFKEAMALWPLANFTADTFIERCLDGSLFSLSEKIQLEKMMRVAMQASELSIETGGNGTGAVIAYGSEILAIGCDARKLHPLKHAVMSAIDMIGWIRQAKSFSPPPWFGHHLHLCNETVATQPMAYLCTNYDAFLTQEPCTMCAMALLHNRFKRIFYGCPNQNGALNSVMKLHTLPDINHRYEVYAGVLEQECSQLVTQSANQDFKHLCFK